MSCPALSHEQTFTSHISFQSFTVVGFDPDQVSCKWQNYIYLLSCNRCGVQYVGESVTPINKRINTHRTLESSCKRVNEHYSEVCPGAFFTVQVIEKLPGNGYVKGKLDSAMMRDRRKREDGWIKKLRTASRRCISSTSTFPKVTSVWFALH